VGINITVRCTFPGFQSAFCYKYFAALPLPFMNEEEGAAHRNIIIMAKSAFSLALNNYFDIQKYNISVADLQLVTIS
jgi:hypothetical protein